MVQPPPYQVPAQIKVRYQLWMPIVFVVTGSIMLVVAVLALAAGGLSYWLILGPLFLAVGVLYFYNPLLTYDPATGNIYMHGAFGNKVRTFGPGKGERLYFDGSAIVRLRPDGKHKRVKTTACRPEDVLNLHRAIAALSQPPAA